MAKNNTNKTDWRIMSDEPKTTVTADGFKKRRTVSFVGISEDDSDVTQTYKISGTEEAVSKKLAKLGFGLDSIYTNDVLTSHFRITTRQQSLFEHVKPKAQIWTPEDDVPIEEENISPALIEEDIYSGNGTPDEYDEELEDDDLNDS